MILVTGATGLLGSHLLYFLAKENKQVKAFVRDIKNINKIKQVFSYYSAEHLINKVEFAEGDICDYYSVEEALNNVTQVYHCAALVSLNDNDYTLLYKTNVEGTANIANVCLEKQVKLCYVSSIATLGEANENNLITEKDNWTGSNNKSAYSITKFNAEREIWRAIEEGLNAFIINPSLIIGAGNWGSGSSNLIKQAYKGMRFKTTGTTGFVDVRDVAQIAIKLMEKDIKKERFIINENNYSFFNFFSITASIFNKKKPSIKISKALINIIVLLLRAAKVFGLKTQITSSAIDAAFNKKYFDNTKVVELTGWKFIPLKESLNFACKKYLQEINKN